MKSTIQSKLFRIGLPIVALLACCAVILLTISQASAQEDYPPGASRIVIMYKCDAANRPAALTAMRKNGVHRFEEWKKEGVIKDYLLLYNSFCDENTWDVMAVLSFETYVQTDKWRDVEEKFPGGLDNELTALLTPTQTYLSEAKWVYGAELDKKNGLYMVIPYEHPDRNVYIDYVNSVLVPQFDGWMREGAINNWSILLTNHYPGKPWDVLLFLEYDGVDGLSQRGIARKATAKRLEEDPAWLLLREEVSHQFRDEYEVVTARAIVPDNDAMASNE